MKRKFEVRSPKPKGRLACESQERNSRFLWLSPFSERLVAAGVASQCVMDLPSFNLLLQIALCMYCAGVVGSLLAIAGPYHTVNHTIFKALAFLGAGAVLHAMHSLWHGQAATN